MHLSEIKKKNNCQRQNKAFFSHRSCPVCPFCPSPDPTGETWSDTEAYCRVSHTDWATTDVAEFRMKHRGSVSFPALGLDSTITSRAAAGQLKMQHLEVRWSRFMDMKSAVCQAPGLGLCTSTYPFVCFDGE